MDQSTLHRHQELQFLGGGPQVEGVSIQGYRKYRDRGEGAGARARDQVNAARTVHEGAIVRSELKALGKVLHHKNTRQRLVLERPYTSEFPLFIMKVNL